jgi:hypothetical protein
VSESAAARYRSLVARADKLSAKLERRPDPATERELAGVERELRVAKAAMLSNDENRLSALEEQATEEPERFLEVWLDALTAAGLWSKVVTATAREIERLQTVKGPGRDRRRLERLVARHNEAIGFLR